MLQIIKAILKDSKDTTRVSLLFANQVHCHAVSITYCSSSGIVCTIERLPTNVWKRGVPGNEGVKDILCPAD